MGTGGTATSSLSSPHHNNATKPVSLAVLTQKKKQTNCLFPGPKKWPFPRGEHGGKKYIYILLNYWNMIQLIQRPIYKRHFNRSSHNFSSFKKETKILCLEMSSRAKSFHDAKNRRMESRGTGRSRKINKTMKSGDWAPRRRREVLQRPGPGEGHARAGGTPGPAPPDGG